LTDKIKIFFPLLIIFLIMSCSDVQKRQEPDKLLSKDEMVKIYTDMVLLDAVYRTNPRKFNAFELEASEHIYNKFKIDSTTLSQNIEYYNLDFETNAEIYERVKINVEERKQNLDSIEKMRDSLKEVQRQKEKSQLNDSVTLPKKLIKAESK